MDQNNCVLPTQQYLYSVETIWWAAIIAFFQHCSIHCLTSSAVNRSQLHIPTQWVWNSLSVSVHTAPSLTTFCWQLKTFLYRSQWPLSALSSLCWHINIVRLCLSLWQRPPQQPCNTLTVISTVLFTLFCRLSYYHAGPALGTCDTNWLFYWLIDRLIDLLIIVCLFDWLIDRSINQLICWLLFNWLLILICHVNWHPLW